MGVLTPEDGDFDFWSGSAASSSSSHSSTSSSKWQQYAQQSLVLPHPVVRAVVSPEAQTTADRGEGKR